MNEINYYNKIFARNYDIFMKSGYYDYKKLVMEFKIIVKGKELLELGIGTGGLAEEMIKQGYTVEGIEPSEHMIEQLKNKNIPIKIYKQDSANINTGKKYDAIYSIGATPFTVLRKSGIFFDTYVIDKKEFFNTMIKSYEHLREGGFFMCGVQEEDNDNASIEDIYKNKSVFEGDIIIKTHYFKEGNKWFSQIVKARIWTEKEFVNTMEDIGFKTIGLNDSKTWYVFQKVNK